MDKVYQIFVSFTDEKLKEERRIVKETIFSMHHIPILMDMFNAKDEEVWKKIKSEIQSSDYYVLVIGHKYGRVFEKGEYAGISYAHRAFLYALEQEIPILAFLIDSNAPVLPEKIEQDADKKDKLEQFIIEIQGKGTIQWWTSTEELANKVFIALNREIIKEKGVERVREISEEIFLKYGIVNSEILNLKNYNIIIGKNGAGKTRLLKALRDGLMCENMAIVYAYFPNMHANFGIGLSEGKYEVPLYEMIFEGENIELGDFIQYIEQHGYDFLIELLRDIDNFSRYKKSRMKKRAESVRDDLNEILGILVDRELKFEAEIIVKSNSYGSEKKLKDDLDQMSPGELALFYLSILLVIIKYNKNESQKLAVLLDEPELHLHPRALINFMDYLKRNKTIEICCIATHSIFLIPLFDFYEIIHIERGEIQAYNSKLYSDIFDNIIGENERLIDFLVSRDMWQYYQFVSECFYLPAVVDKVNTKDEQFLKFLAYVEEFAKSKRNITILDFGAGEGRLGKTINAMGNSENYIRRKIKYYYFDRYQKKPADLECVAFSSIEEIQESQKKFNCVILMNVLHEIDINEWEKTLLDIHHILEDDGYLLIFEVITLLHGEQPYGDNGYILLGEKEIRQLFCDSDIGMIKLKDTDKTRMFIIPKTIIKNVSQRTISNALVSLQKNLYKELHEQYLLRKRIAHEKEKASHRLIKNYGFLSQHYLNCLFAIEVLQKEKKTYADIEVVNDVDDIMFKIGKNPNAGILYVLRKRLLSCKSDKDRDKINTYRMSGNYYQRKSARYYFYNEKN